MGKRLTTEQFIEKALKVHGNKYDYSKTEYINSLTKVTIICPDHGDFEQVPSNHTRGKGCLMCGKVQMANAQRKTTKEFVKQANVIHNNKYDYAKVKYTKNSHKVTITCPAHGDFTQIPSSHLSGCGCNNCGIELVAKNQTKSTKEIIERCVEVHGSRYNYSATKYINADTKLNIICPIHGEFKQLPGNHCAGQGCPACAVMGFDQTKPAILYYLKVTTDDKILYKIGITSRTVNERFYVNDLKKIEVLHQEKFMTGQEALDKETEIKRKFKEFQYNGPNVLSSGNTELFTCNIFELL